MMAKVCVSWSQQPFAYCMDRKWLSREGTFPTFKSVWKFVKKRRSIFSSLDVLKDKNTVFLTEYVSWKLCSVFEKHGMLRFILMLRFTFGTLSPFHLALCFPVTHCTLCKTKLETMSIRKEIPILLRN
jgi:hypothetical protein